MYNETELEKLITDHFCNNGRAPTRLEDAEIEVAFYQDTVTVTLKKMYSGIAEWVNFDDMSFLSDLLKTKNINLQNEYYSGGCESCDFGSSNSIDIVCSNAVYAKAITKKKK